MGKNITTRKYRCDNDCKMCGCPEHTATLEFNSISNTYIFNDGQGQEIFLDISLATVMLEMFKFYSDTRKDTAKI